MKYYRDTTNYYLVFECDICKRRTSKALDGEYEKDTISRLRKLGLKIGKKHQCPNCVGTKRDAIR